MKARFGRFVWWLGFRFTWLGAHLLGHGAMLQQSVPHAEALARYADLNTLATAALEIHLERLVDPARGESLH